MSAELQITDSVNVRFDIELYAVSNRTVRATEHHIDLYVDVLFYNRFLISYQAPTSSDLIYCFFIYLGCYL